MGYTDKDSKKCVKSSTKCIIWFGGKLACIDVCDNEALETVIKKIDRKLKSLFEKISISDLDLSAVLGEKECPPKDIGEVLQLILNKINDCCSGETSVQQAYGTIVPADCFQDALGTKAVSLENYLSFIGSYVCKQTSEINTLKSTINQFKTDLDILKSQVNLLIGG